MLRSRERSRLAMLQAALLAAVPIGIADLQRQGGPVESDYDWLGSDRVQKALLVDSAALASGAPCRGVLGVLCRAISIMAFSPGGVRPFGLHFEAKNSPASRQGRRDGGALHNVPTHVQDNRQG